MPIGPARRSLKQQLPESQARKAGLLEMMDEATIRRQLAEFKNRLAHQTRQDSVRSN
jgi:hypothetical protein